MHPAHGIGTCRLCRHGGYCGHSRKAGGEERTSDSGSFHLIHPGLCHEEPHGPYHSPSPVQQFLFRLRVSPEADVGPGNRVHRRCDPCDVQVTWDRED